MREHFLDPKDAEVFFGEDGRISALAKVDDPIFNVYVQTGIRRSGLFWYQNFIRNMEYKDLGTPEGRTGCSFGFTAYDQNGRLLVNVVKKY